MFKRATPCECDIPGVCKRHVDASGNPLFKDSYWHHLCRHHPDFFSNWESGIGLGQTKDSPPLAVDATIKPNKPKKSG